MNRFWNYVSSFYYGQTKSFKRPSLDLFNSLDLIIFDMDGVLTDFDSRFKGLPPIRSEKDRIVLVKAVLDGTIDFVTSDHAPIDIDNKKTDFKNSLFGATGLESIFGALNSLYKTEEVIDILTRKKDFFGINSDVVMTGMFIPVLFIFLFFFTTFRFVIFLDPDIYIFSIVILLFVKTHISAATLIEFLATLQPTNQIPLVPLLQLRHNFLQILSR